MKCDIDDRQKKANALHSLAKYFALMINDFKLNNDDSARFVFDEITINVANRLYYDSVEMNCPIFRYFITQYEADEYRFTVLEKPAVAILSEIRFTSADLSRHEAFHNIIKKCLEHAADNFAEGYSNQTDDFPPPV